MTVHIIGRDGNDCEIGETTYNPNSYRCYLAIVREKDGSYSAIVLNLPGAGSCGDSEEEAIANAKFAISAVVEEYCIDGKDIPWVEEYSVPEGAKLKWILVNG